MTTMARPAGAFTTRLRYTDRNSKAVYIADKYAPILIGSVLDVGCGDGALRKLVHQPFRYVGVDRRTDADRIVDRDVGSLPFPDRHFDTVLCTEVLEHLRRRTEVFDELCRVARGHVIVSLPGLAAGWELERDETVQFVASRARANGFDVVQMDAEDFSAARLETPQGSGGQSQTGGSMWFVLGRSQPT